MDVVDQTPTDRAPERSGAGENRSRGKGKLPQWVDAVPADLNIDDQLEVVARFNFRSLIVALARVHADPFMKVALRVQLITQINAQMVAVMDKRRIWLAEQIIKGNERAIAETQTGTVLEARSHATRADGTQQASRPTTRRGRPRKR